MEAELTVASKETSNTENFALVEEANVDEVITVEDKSRNETRNGLQDERKTKSYEDSMKIDIEDNNSIEKRNKLYTKKWREIYEVIQQLFLSQMTYLLITLYKM